MRFPGLLPRLTHLGIKPRNLHFVPLQKSEVGESLLSKGTGLPSGQHELVPPRNRKGSPSSSMVLYSKAAVERFQ